MTMWASVTTIGGMMGEAEWMFLAGILVLTIFFGMPEPRESAPDRIGGASGVNMRATTEEPTRTGDVGRSPYRCGCRCYCGNGSDPH